MQDDPAETRMRGRIEPLIGFPKGPNIPGQWVSEYPAFLRLISKFGPGIEMPRTPTFRFGVVLASLVYFGLVFGAGFVLGSIRVPFLVPQLGVRWAELLEAPFMATATYIAASFVVRKLDVPRSAAHRIAVGLMALAVLVSAELMLAALLQGLTPAEYIASRDPISGPVYFALLGLFAAMPCLLLLRRR